MRSRSILSAALITGVALAAAACGSQVASTTPGGAGASSHAARSPVIARTCAGSVRPAPAGSTLTLGNRDNGTAFCLRSGQHVLVYLNGSPAHMWGPIHSVSSDLRPAPNGHLMLMRGVTGAFFTAVRPGMTRLTSTRQACSGTRVRCGTTTVFQVTVVIVDKAA